MDLEVVLRSLRRSFDGRFAVDGGNVCVKTVKMDMQHLLTDYDLIA